MAMMQGFSNAFRIPTLRKKIMVTLGLVVVCRLVSQVWLPGIDLEVLATHTRGGGSNALMNMLDIFTGGGISQCSIGFLSIWPYISAQIMIQLLGSVIPQLAKMKKDGENGRQQLAQITRIVAIVICVFQAWGIASVLQSPELCVNYLGLSGAVAHDVHPLGFPLMTVIGMTSASLFIMWIADQITTFGIGNGGSLIIMINITSRFPVALTALWRKYVTEMNLNPTAITTVALLALFFVVVVMGTVMLTQGVRKVAIHSTRRAVAGGASYGMQQTFMPLRVNYTGVMPIIFAQPIIQVLAWLLKLVSWEPVHDFGEALSTLRGPGYLVMYAVLIMFFTFFWVATQFNAIDISDNLKKEGSYVPGIRPGRATAEYLDDVMTKITLIGGSGLLVVALVPLLLSNIFQVEWVVASFFGGTSLLIVVGVALDTLRIMESHLLVRKYEGFLSHGSLRGRGGM